MRSEEICTVYIGDSSW